MTNGRSEVATGDFSLTRGEFLHGARQSVYLVIKRRSLMILGVGLIISGLGLVTTSLNVSLDLFVLGILLVSFPSVAGVVIPRVWWRSNPAYREVRHVYFGDESVDSVRSAKRSGHPWTAIARVSCSGALYTFYARNGRMLLIVPSRAFLTVHDEGSFRELARRKTRTTFS